MNKILVLLVFLILSVANAYSQAKRFTNSGTITFEKSVNMFAVMEKMIDKNNESFYRPIYEQYRRSKPQFKKLTSTLIFNRGESLFTPVEDVDQNNFFSNAMITQNNVIYNNLNTNTTITQKTVYEEKFLVKDSLRHINWKLTDERREIAGYPCRRANALVMDSIYVVAFYTDEIPTSAGPESFTGLPGMILGLALPHENITWFATKVVDQAITPAQLKAPTKGKLTDFKKLKQTILTAMNDWGNYGKTALKALML